MKNVEDYIYYKGIPNTSALGIPEGYKELKENDIIQEDDLAFRKTTQNWMEESSLGKGTDATGQTYIHGSHYLTVRKIGEKLPIKEKELIKDKESSKEIGWKFFRRGNDPYLVASNEKGGFLFYKTSKSHFNSIRSDYSIKNCFRNNYKEIANIEDALKLIDAKFRHRIYEILDIKRELVEITEKQKQTIINLFKKSRAFNGDSALEVKGKNIDICYQLANQGILKTINNKFYLEN